VTFTDHSSGELDYSARFVSRDGARAEAPGSPVPDTGDRGRLVEEVAIDDPVCITVRPTGGEQVEPTDAVCRMAVSTNAGERLVAATGLVSAIELAAGQCATIAPGQGADDPSAWFRRNPCTDGFSIRAYLHEAPTAIRQVGPAQARCGAVAQDRPEPGFSRYRAYVGEDQRGRRALTCAWVR
jgi:hypothetical protein